MPPGVFVLGLGSGHGDDAVGWIVIERLREQIGDAVHFGRVTAPDGLFNFLPGPCELHVVDGCQNGSPGAVYRWEWPHLPTAWMASYYSSHLLGLADVLRLADRLALLPAKLVVWGIEIAESAPGLELSLSMEESVQKVVEAIVHEIQCQSTANSRP